MNFLQYLRRRTTLAWLIVEKSFSAVVEETVRQVELIKLSSRMQDCERQMDAVYEKLGIFLYEAHGQGLKEQAMASHAVSQSSLSEFQRLQTELKLIGQRRYILKEEEAATHWAEFVEAVHKNGMTLETLILPVHLKPPTTTLRDLNLPSGVLVIAIQRNERFIQPHGPVRVERGDRLTLLGSPALLDQVTKRFAQSSEPK